MLRSTPPRPAVRRALGANLGVLLLLLAACAGGAGEEPRPGLVVAVPEPVKITFDLPDFDPAATHRTLSRDPRSGNEVRYAAFSGASSFAAVVLVEAGPGYTLEPRDTTRHFARMLPATTIAWGDRGNGREEGAADPGTGYRRFALPEMGFHCFAFDRQWRPALDEDGGRWYTRQGFGFYCRMAELALGDDDVRRVLARIRFANGDA